MTDVDRLRRWQISNPIFASDELNPNLAVSPWAGHRDFVYDWIAFTRPRRVVELGTHYGCSFFAIAQAVKDFGLATELVAVDTWQGDDHTGPYSETVYDLVRQTIADHFSSLPINLLRKTFSEALIDVADASISMLHIDGYHTFDAVRHDFETWQQKLAPDAVVLFHDVAPSSCYGSADYWVEIRQRYPHLEFLEHSFGLGVLFPTGDTWYRRFQQAGCLEWIEYYRYKAEARLAKRESADKTIMIDDRDALIAKLESWVRDRDDAISAIEAMVDERDALITKLESWVRDRDEAISTIEAMVSERDALIAKLESLVRDR